MVTGGRFSVPLSPRLPRWRLLRTTLIRPAFPLFPPRALPSWMGVSRARVPIVQCENVQSFSLCRQRLSDESGASSLWWSIEPGGAALHTAHRARQALARRPSICTNKATQTVKSRFDDDRVRDQAHVDELWRCAQSSHSLSPVESRLKIVEARNAARVLPFPVNPGSRPRPRCPPPAYLFRLSTFLYPPACASRYTRS